MLLHAGAVQTFTRRHQRLKKSQKENNKQIYKQQRDGEKTTTTPNAPRRHEGCQRNPSPPTPKPLPAEPFPELSQHTYTRYFTTRNKEGSSTNQEETKLTMRQAENGLAFVQQMVSGTDVFISLVKELRGNGAGEGKKLAIHFQHPADSKLKLVSSALAENCDGHRTARKDGCSIVHLFCLLFLKLKVGLRSCSQHGISLNFLELIQYCQSFNSATLVQEVSKGCRRAFGGEYGLEGKEKLLTLISLSGWEELQPASKQSHVKCYKEPQEPNLLGMGNGSRCRLMVDVIQLVLVTPGVFPPVQLNYLDNLGQKAMCGRPCRETAFCNYLAETLGTEGLPAELCLQVVACGSSIKASALAQKSCNKRNVTLMYKQDQSSQI
ncbi:hypothetical protein Anapl_13004 [Anas platyrhynchos]|uniref:Uncharacterized protein n=1 Tax=Anas platyrhynchos TaxID=8839 RepID=R0JQC6_ANAPL|nr:hypothetical protein Anapl_13004 [Anas platyrhynchos]